MENTICLCTERLMNLKGAVRQKIASIQCSLYLENLSKKIAFFFN